MAKRSRTDTDKAPLANVKVDAELLRQLRLRAARDSVKAGRLVTLQELFQAALRRYLKG